MIVNKVLLFGTAQDGVINIIHIDNFHSNATIGWVTDSI
ncbi:hypothetical protein N483_16630 [Pseudoalteromonas luteoviolacea NCIMB 1944]|uniref:Uncharacterized protein n=1 Tax=Pseudoalteromonas luteoviolacea (strain 2ta16) TaxID=1353533 RepID=V4J960_PSEL2|nr:hypothetical protein PL2TA16_05408 [Pseudoalteromonas luteoviolacea 2ta16]KZN40754.1 hypothetical protein N483_16630 [Pseudoalteromonas luteoviolacea NCIMB 1944]